MVAHVAGKIDADAPLGEAPLPVPLLCPVGQWRMLTPSLGPADRSYSKQSGSLQ